MNRKQLALIAAACGALVFLGVLLPWLTVEVGNQSKSFGGLTGTAEFFGRKVSLDFVGVPVLLLSLLGGAAALLVFLGKTHLIPIDARQHLFAALALFLLAFILTLTDFFGDVFEGDRSPGQGIGLVLTLIATLGGGVTAFLATLRPSSD